MIEDANMSSNIIDTAIKSIQYKYLLLRKDYKGLDQAIEEEEDKATDIILCLKKA